MLIVCQVVIIIIILTFADLILQLVPVDQSELQVAQGETVENDEYV